jgi:hypothetical protein
MTLLAPAAAQLVLASVLVFASVSAGTQGAAPLKATESAPGFWSEREGALLRLTKRIIQTSFLRHISVTIWIVWEVWNSNGKASATFGEFPQATTRKRRG